MKQSWGQWLWGGLWKRAGKAAVGRGLRETQEVPGSTRDQTRGPAVEVHRLTLRTSRGSPSSPCV